MRTALQESHDHILINQEKKIQAIYIKSATNEVLSIIPLSLFMRSFLLCIIYYTSRSSEESINSMTEERITTSYLIIGMIKLILLPQIKENLLILGLDI